MNSFQNSQKTGEKLTLLIDLLSLSAILLGAYYYYSHRQLIGSIIYKDVYLNTLYIFFFISFLLIIFSISHFRSWAIQKSKASLLQSKSEFEEQAYLKYCEHLDKYANDIILLLDTKRKIIECNDSAVAVYGYSRDELVNLLFKDLRSPGAYDSIDNISKNVQNKKGAVFDSIHLRKDGKPFPVEVTTLEIEIEGKKYIQCVIRDITERKDSENKLKGERRLLNTVIENLPEQIYVKDRESRFLLCNSIVALNAGCRTVREMIGKTDFDFFPLELATQYRADELALMESDKAFINHEEQIIDKRTGKLHWNLTTKVPMKDKTGKVIGLIGLTQDITDRKQAEKDLFDTKEQFRTIFENTTIGLYRTTKDGQIILANPALITMLGYSTFDELATRNLEESGFKSKHSRAEFKEKIGKKGKIIGEETIWTNVNGQDVIVRENAIVVKDVNGSILYYEGTAENITELKKTEEKTIQSEVRFRSVWENSFDAFRLCNEDGIVIKVNDAFCRIFEIPREKIEGFTFNVAYVHYEFTLAKFIENIKTHSIIPKLETEINLLNNKHKWVELSNSLIEIKNQPTLLLSIFRDITERKRLESELIADKEKAEEMSRLKTNFLANMSHELRTPMIGILGFSEILKEEIKDPGQKEMIESIYSSGARLLQTLNQLLDLSRIESNKFDIVLTPVDLSGIVAECIKRYKGAATKGNLYLRQIDIKENISVIADERIFEQILDNLLNNALKFTKSGGITVEVDEDIANDIAWAVLRVSDTGIGIPKESISIIFEEFRQASEGFGRKFEGTGIGLTITKRFVEIMNGTILVESKEGFGSTFTVRFPSVKGTAHRLEVLQKLEATNVDTISESIKKPKILFVENDKNSREFVKLALEKLYEVDLVDDEKTAVQKVKDNYYDLILMDIGLGLGMDGIETSKEIRKIKGYKNIPIIAVTAFAMKSDKERIISEGLTDYISKPFARQDLITLVKKHLLLLK